MSNVDVAEATIVSIPVNSHLLTEIKVAGFRLPEGYARSPLTRIQRALHDVFRWADEFNIKGEEKIREQIHEVLFDTKLPVIHEFNRRSNGATRITSNELEYEGASELANEGFSVQSEAKILRPFDRD